MTGPGGAGGSGGEVLGAGGVGGGDDGEDAAGLGGEFDVAGVGEVEAVVAGGGDEDDVGLGGGVGDLVEGGEEAGAVSGGEVGGGADGEGDDVGAVGDGVFDALHDPAEEAAGLAGFALVGGVLSPVMAAGMRWRTLMLRMVAAGATPMTWPVPGPMAAAASEAVQVPWPCWSCGVPSSQGVGKADWSTSVRLRARLGAMSGWDWSTPLSMMAMRTPLPMVVSQGPCAGPPGTLLP